MAFRSMNYWRQMSNSLKGAAGRASYASSTSSKMKAYAPTADSYHHQSAKGKLLKGDFVPVYVAIGLIALQMAFGLHTAKQQLKYSPNVNVRKKRRETVPEVVEPDHVAEEAEKFFRNSFFRKVAHVQEFDLHDYSIPKDAIRGEAYAHRPHVESLQSVGVDPASTT